MLTLLAYCKGMHSEKLGVISIYSGVFYSLKQIKRKLNPDNDYYQSTNKIY